MVKNEQQNLADAMRFEAALEEFSEYVFEGQRSEPEISSASKHLCEMLEHMIEKGFDINTVVDDYTFFENVDCEVIFGATYGMRKEFFDAYFYCWLLMIGNGGRLKNNKLPILLKNGINTNIFKKYNQFYYSLDFARSDWTMNIYDIETGETVAIIE